MSDGFLFRRTYRLVSAVLCSLLWLWDASARGEFDTAAFQRMDLQEQRRVIREALELRRKALQNLEMVSVSENRMHKFADGKIVERADVEATRSEFHFKRLDGSYWLSLRLFAEGHRPDGPLIVSHFGFEEREGVSRTIGLENNGKPLHYARIDSKRNNTVLTNWAAHYVADWINIYGDRLLSDMIDEADHWAIETDPDENEITLTYPDRHEAFSKMNGYEGVWRTVLDGARDLVPVRSEQRYRVVIPNGNDIWREMSVEMRDVREIEDGIWIPHDIEEVVRANSLGGGSQCSVTVTKVESVALGEVSQEDLVVEFPEGTHVVDALQGVSYTIGADGNPVQPPEALHRPIDLTAPADASATTATSTSRRLLLWINGIGFGAIILFLAIKRLVHAR